MNTEARRAELNAISQKIIAAAYKVHNVLGAGFLEKVYENALAIEIRKAGLVAEQQFPLKVYYGGVVVGDYNVDLMAGNNDVVVELKVAKSLDDSHLAKCLNYLKAAKMSLCLLINFGAPKVEVKRVVNDF